MKTITISSLDDMAAARRERILHAADDVRVRGRSFYLSNDGNDQNDGLSPKSPWQSLTRLGQAPLEAGDGVFFRRGDVFRGTIEARAGVTYAAYGSGEKPRLYGWDRDMADVSLWVLHDAERCIWKYAEPILDVGTLVFDEGARVARKLIPSYIQGRFVCREDESRPFDLRQEMTNNLDLYWHYDQRLTDKPSKGENFLIPVVDEKSYGELYLRCDAGNPASVFAQIEALPKRCMFRVGDQSNVRIDNLCIRYVGHHAISAGGHVIGLQVTNCEIGWIGGTIQHYFGTDPNYPQGGRGTVTRFGNGVEIYGGCEDYRVENCYIYECYDAAMTHQITTHGAPVIMKGVRYRGNLVERCVYSIEYFLEMSAQDPQSHMEDILMEDNILRLSGYGWGQQRHNQDTPAHIKGWSYVNRASHYIIRKNVFDRAAYRMLHVVALESESCPLMEENTYAQYLGNPLGQYGANQDGEPPILPFDELAEERIARVFGDRQALVYACRE